MITCKWIEVRRIAQVFNIKSRLSFVKNCKENSLNRFDCRLCEGTVKNIFRVITRIDTVNGHVRRSIALSQSPSEGSQTEFAVGKSLPTILWRVLVKLMKLLLRTPLNWLVCSCCDVDDSSVTWSFQKWQKLDCGEKVTQVIWLKRHVDLVFGEFSWMIDDFVAVD